MVCRYMYEWTCRYVYVGIPTFLSLLIFLLSRLAHSRMPDRDWADGAVLETRQKLLVPAQDASERGGAAERVDRDPARAQSARRLLRTRPRRGLLRSRRREERHGRVFVIGGRFLETLIGPDHRPRDDKVVAGHGRSRWR